MDLLWPALGISVIVGFVFFVMAGHWGKVLRQQASAISRLSHRLQMIEEVDDPHFRERLSESSPAPLEQVITFTLRFTDQFWRETLGLTANDWEFVRASGSFVGSVKLERWRSHTLATVTEILPNRKTAAWQNRSLYYYPAAAQYGEPLTLWDVPLARPRPGERPPALELTLRGDALELIVNSAHSTGNGNGAIRERVLLATPLHARLLAPFRGHDPAEISNGNGSANGNGVSSWRTYYAAEDENLGIEWQLRMVDLNRKVDWERWKILDSTAPRVTSAS
jgi:hypothetical protein